jgi:Bacterial regulatory proteins, luxR family
VKLVGEGHTNNQIAKILNITVRTVETHRASAMRKLNVSSSAGLVRHAVRIGPGRDLMPGHHHNLPQTDVRGTEGPRGGRDVRRQRTIALAQPTMGGGRIAA